MGRGKGDGAGLMRERIKQARIKETDVPYKQDLLSFQAKMMREHYSLSSTLLKHSDITSGLQLGKAEVVSGLRNFVHIDRPEHRSIDRPKERGAEKGSGRHSTLREPPRWPSG